MSSQNKFIVRSAIALVWLLNGLYAKLLAQVPRHQLIVARFFGSEHAPMLTKMIGILEILMAFWVLSARRQRHCALVQIVFVASMNTLEFFYARDLLLWGGWNACFAVLLCLTVYYNGFGLHSSKNQEHAVFS
jgi:hypothetical protein